MIFCEASINNNLLAYYKEHFKDIMEVFHKKEEDFDLNNLDIFFPKFEKLLFHTIEEVIEFFDTLYSDLKEFVDVFNYTNTLMGYIKELCDRNLVEWKEYKFNELFDKNIINYHLISMNIIKELTDIRRIFPNRKYHIKTSNKLENKEENLKEMNKKVFKIYYYVIMLGSTGSLTNISEQIVLDMSRKKRELIISNYKNI
jgi:hypothetical protein